MSTAHRVIRPLWMCAVDGQAWPCAPARTMILDLCGGRGTATQRHMAQLMAQTEAEIGVLDTGALYRRFVAWALAPGERCRVCESTQHAVIPGIPPRLVPCRDLHAVLAERSVRAEQADG